MNKRLGKQILYGAGFLFLIFLFLFGIYWFWLKPAPSCFDAHQNQNETGIDCGGLCEPCEIKTLSLPETTFVKVFPADDKTIAIAEIKNPNPEWGAAQLDYEFNLYDPDGNKMDDLSGKTFIYPGEIKKLVEPIDTPAKNVGRVEITFSNPVWKSKTEFPKPETQLRELKTEEDRDSQRISVSGFIANKNPYVLSKIRTIALLYNKAGVPIAASKTENEKIDPFSEFSFKINFLAGIRLEGPAQTSFVKNLAVGSKNEDVKKLQSFLKENGSYSGDISGYFGQSTKTAVTNYQKQNKIPSTGSFDSKTRTFVNSEIAKRAIPAMNEADPARTAIYIEASR